MKRLFLLGLVSLAFGQIELPSLTGSWPTATKGILAGLVGAFILVGVVIVVLETLKRKRQNLEREAVSEAAFNSLAQKAALNPNERMLLLRLARHSGISQLEEVFTQLYAFEKGVEEEIENCRSDPMLLNNVCDSILGLRRKMGYHLIPAGVPYCSSRELVVGQDIVLHVPENPMVKYRSVIQHINELELVVKRPELGEGAAPFKTGMGTLGIRVSLYRPQDAEYSFKTEILRESPDKQFLVLGHTLSLDRHQLRGYVRLEIRLQTKFRFIKAADKERTRGGTRFSGTLVDISGGGCNLQTAESYQANDVIMMSFNFMGEAFYGIKGEILRVKPKTVNGVPAFFHPIRFLDIENPVRERIISLIFEKQREDAQWRKGGPLG